MKLLMLSPLPPPSGGIASWTIQYRKYCEKSDINLCLVNTAMVGRRATIETMTKNFTDEVKRICHILYHYIKSQNKFSPDVIHINTSCSKFGILRDALCLFLAKKQSFTIIHCHCNIEDQIQGTIGLKIFRYIVRNSDKVIVLNKASKNYVDRIIKDKSIIIPNFIEKSVIDHNHVIHKKIKNVIYVGHVEEEKGLYKISETARLNPHLNFTLVGAVREDIFHLDVPSNMKITGRVPFEEVKSKLKDADVFLFPSKSEGFSIALLEAMAMGLPIIASDVGANFEMIGNDGGIILKENSAGYISAALSEIEPADIRTAMSIWNVKKVESAYLIDDIMDQYKTIYKNRM